MRPRQALQRAAKQKESVRIVRRGTNLYTVYGFPLAIGKSLVLICAIDEFDVDGFIVLPLRDITDVRSGEIERFTERVLRDRREIRHVRSPAFPMGVGDWSQVFSRLGGEREIVIVESERKDDNALCIGVVTGLTPDSVGIHQF